MAEQVYYKAFPFEKDIMEKSFLTGLKPTEINFEQ